jgi:acyl transferase domain-containing protein
MGIEARSEQLTPLQNAIYLLKQTQARLAAYERAQAEPIAVIGIGCRFPGGENPAAYWRVLRDGVDAIREVPADRWNIDDFYDPDPTAPGKMNTRWGGFLDGVDEFDAEFFGISPREAVRVDPQQRLLLEVAWEALEDAGWPATEIARSRAGVFIGVIGSDYGMLQSRDITDMDVFSGTGISHAILANRLSYFLNLTGPSVTLDTACSSSLVTVHLACQSLRRREADVALAGGVNLIVSPEMTLVLTKAHMLAPDGRCKTFDASANGYVRGEGCGLVVLKRLSDALAAGDRISAVIRGSAVNHDGRSNGLSAPNGLAQESVIRAALQDAGLAPQAVGYVEAHGTGTRLGDPIEIEALRTVLCAGRAPDQPLVVGSVKTNIGHLESAAGIAGLIKVILMLRHDQIPPHLHLRTLNPLLKIEDASLVIPTTLQAWAPGTEPRRAGVSSFGFGGTNAHIILEEAPLLTRVENEPERPRHIVTVSARSADALAQLAGRYADWLGEQPGPALADLAFTANAGRTHFSHRAAVVADSRPAAREKLQRLSSEPLPSGVQRGAVEYNAEPRVAFLFTGQGAQYAGMGRALYETQPTFRTALDRCAACLDRVLDRPLQSLLEPSAGSLLDQTGYTQPVMFALEYALAALWRSWGVEPAAVMGHSVGEFAAACIAGVYELEDGLRLIAERARLMQSLPAGGLMAAVFAEPERVAEVLREFAAEVGIAAYNGPRNVVVSGAEGAVRDVLAAFEAQGVKSKPLATSHPFHSHWLDPILEPLSDFAGSLSCRPPQIKLVSNLTGQLADARTYADPGYWSRHARSPVQFAAGMRTLAECGCEVFLEIGPAPTLIGMGARCLADESFRWLPSLRSGHDDWQTMLESVAELYVSGVPIDWSGFDRDYRRRRVALPTCPFQRQRFWAKSAAEPYQSSMPTSPRGGRPLHPLLGRRLTVAIADKVFESQVSASRPALLADHRLQGAVVMPGAAFLELALAASAAAYGTPWTVRDAAIVEPLVLDQQPRTLQTILTGDGDNAASFRIVSRAGDDDGGEPSFTTHAAGRIEAPAGESPAAIDIAAQRARFASEPRDAAWQAEALRKSGLEPGPTFCWIDWHWLQARDALGQVRSARDSDRVAEYRIHPGLLDGAVQLLAAAIPGAGSGIDPYIPVSVGRLRLYERQGAPAWCLSSLRLLERDFVAGGVTLVDDHGRVQLEVEDLRLRRVPRTWLARLVSAPRQDWLYELTWLPQPLEAGNGGAGPAERGAWLVFDGSNGLGTALAQRLEIKGQTCRVTVAADTDSRRAEVRRFLADRGSPCRGIVYLSGLDVASQSLAAGPDFAAARGLGWGGMLDVVRAAAESAAGPSPRLWVVTRGAQAIGSTARPVELTQSPVWGLGRVIAAEHPEFACTRIDLDPAQPRDEADQLMEEIWFGGREDQIALRGVERYVTRLRPVTRARAGELELPPGQPYRLDIVERGQLDQVALRPARRQPPGPGQVELRVRATGLNFRDVLNVLNLYPGDPGPLGGECAGEVAAVGAGVEHVQPGDEVVALAPASFASYVLTLAEFVMPKPAGLSFAEAATIPICFLSAYDALCCLGRMQRGERVLIHAASGGVGLAAIQLARQAGAEIFATAGSPRKRAYLQSLGIAHVMDSRSLDFADQIRAATGDEGVDLVLNSLTGETIASSLSVLRAGGRFLELGKTDLWDQARVAAFRPGVTFHAIALDRMMAEEPETVRRLMHEVVPQFVARKLEPLPLRTFPIRRMIAALRHMARAEHIGKIVITAADTADDGRTLHLPEDGTYLVTGGLGGLGLKLARWLVDHGARQLVLTGRSAPAADATKVLQELAGGGTRVEVRRCDVSQRDEVAALLADIRQTMPPLRGVFHLAGVLDDGILRDQTRERFDRVLAAKAQGAWHLHDLTRDAPLDHFVLFSSAAALLGSPGQGNYAAANAFLDALAHHRRAEQRPALSVNWGNWSEVGMAARLQESQGQRWSEAGIGWIDPDRGLQTLEELLVAGDVQVGVLPVDWAKFFARIPVGAEPAWLSDLAREVRTAGGAQAGGPPVLLEKLRAVTAGERLERATSFLQQQAARVLAMDETQPPDPRRPLNELGFDSLTGVEFCNRVTRAIGQQLNPALLFDYPTLASLAGYVVRDLLHLECGAAAATPASGEAAEAAADETDREQAVAEVEAMSEADLDALVAQQLGRLQPGMQDVAAGPPPCKPVGP